MSISNSQLITEALALIGVIQETEVLSAEQGQHGLRKLNALMADWEQDGVDLQYFEQIALADETPIPDHAILAVTYYLAMALAPTYAARVPPEFVALGDKYYSRLVRDAAKEKIAPTDLRHLTQGEGWGGFYDITTDV